MVYPFGHLIYKMQKNVYPRMSYLRNKCDSTYKELNPETLTSTANKPEHQESIKFASHTSAHLGAHGQ